MKTRVEYMGKRKFKIKVRDFEVITDLPEDKGGEDSSPTPTELFMGSFAACVALYAVNYINTAKLDPKGFAIDMDWDFSEDRPRRVEHCSFVINVPNSELGQREKAVKAAAEKCVIHNTLHNPPQVTFEIEGKKGETDG